MVERLITKRAFSREIQKHQIQQEALLDFFVQFLFSIWGVCQTRRGMFHETEANHANLCLVVDCFRGEIHQSRESEPPERPQREARRPLAQRRPPTGPKKNEGRRKPGFSSLLLFPNHTSTNQVTTEVLSLYPRRCGPRGALGRRQPTQDIPRAITS